jgi:hypothetical protein
VFGDNDVMHPIFLFGPSFLGLTLLALGVFQARTKSAHRSWGVLAGAIMWIQAFLLIGAALCVGVWGGPIIQSIMRSWVLCAAILLWLGCFAARLAFVRRERRMFPAK